jgi:uncharacterized phage protein (TIGR01671 family)
MRIIKFRAWDKDKQRMIVVPSLHFGDDGSARTTMILLRTPEGSTRTLVIGENCELMQFTGLRDKHGAEIYEGDIVRCIDGYNATVVYDEQHGLFSPFGDGEGAEWGKGVEVIGNIYENPELDEVQA